MPCTGGFLVVVGLTCLLGMGLRGLVGTGPICLIELDLFEDNGAGFVSNSGERGVSVGMTSV